jgi:uncharacterized membrane protein YukC
METKMKSRSKALKQRVKKTKVYQGLNDIQKEFIRHSQNIMVIERGLFIIMQAGVKEWSRVSKYSLNNEAVIRELYANNLKVQF